MAPGPQESEHASPAATSQRVPARVATVRTQFDARATSFVAHDALPREIAGRLADRLDYIRIAPERVLDAGCGPGHGAALLHARFPAARVAALDISEGMLGARVRSLRDRLPRWLGGASPIDWVAADAARLPFASDAFELVYSNLMLHWHPQPHTVLPEWKRVLKVGGLLLFSCFGPDTLKEMRAACRLALPHARPMPFIDMHDFGDMLVASGFADPVMDAEVVTLTYRSPQQLLSEVRALGGNPRDDRRSGLTGGTQARRLLDALGERNGTDGQIRLTFEVAYGHAWKPEPRATELSGIDVETLRAELARHRAPQQRKI